MKLLYVLISILVIFIGGNVYSYKITAQEITDLPYSQEIIKPSNVVYHVTMHCGNCGFYNHWDMMGEGWQSDNSAVHCEYCNSTLYTFLMVGYQGPFYNPDTGITHHYEQWEGC